MGKIDDLYKRAFGHSSYSYSDESWTKMDSLLNEKMPVGSAASSVFLKTLSGIAASVVIAGAAYFSSVPEDKHLIIDKDKQLAQVVMEEGRETPFLNQMDISAEGFSNSDFKELIQREETPLDIHSNRTNFKTKDHLKNEGQWESNKQNEDQPLSKHLNNQNKSSLASNHKREKPLYFGLNQSVANSVKQKTGVNNSLVKLKKMGLNIDASTLVLSEVNLFPQTQISNRWKFGKTVSIYGGYESIVDDQKLSVSGVDETGKSKLYNVVNHTYSAGVNARASLKNWFGSIGIGLTQRSSDYTFEETVTNSWEEENVTTNVEFAGFDSVILGQEIRIVERDGVEYMEIVSTKYGIDTTYRTVYDTTSLSHTTTENNQKSFGYKANYLSVPLVIGYEQQINRFSVGAGIGLQMNILSSISGQVYDGTDFQFKSDFKDRLNPIVYAASVQLNLCYDLKPGLSLILQPRVVKSLNSTFKQGDELASNYTGFGTTVALRYKF